MPPTAADQQRHRRLRGLLRQRVLWRSADHPPASGADTGSGTTRRMPRGCTHARCGSRSQPRGGVHSGYSVVTLSQPWNGGFIEPERCRTKGMLRRAGQRQGVEQPGSAPCRPRPDEGAGGSRPGAAGRSAGRAVDGIETRWARCRAADRIGRPLAELLMILAAGKWFDWWGGMTWGYRHRRPGPIARLVDAPDHRAASLAPRVLFGARLAWSVAVQFVGLQLQSVHVVQCKGRKGRLVTLSPVPLHHLRCHLNLNLNATVPPDVRGSWR